MNTILFALAFVATVHAEPTAEAMKAASGMRFAETMGVGDAARQAPAVAGDVSGSKKRAPAYTKKPKREAMIVADPAPQSPSDKPAKESAGTKILETAGGLAGAAATAAAVFINPWAAAALLAGGAIGAAYTAHKNGVTGWHLAASAFTGATEAANVAVNAGIAAGKAVGHVLGKVFAS